MGLQFLFELVVCFIGEADKKEHLITGSSQCQHFYRELIFYRAVNGKTLLMEFQVLFPPSCFHKNHT